jgi:glutaminyl-peptide cyclotransferase
MNKIFIILAFFQLLSLNAFGGEALPKHDNEYLMNLIKTYEKFGPKVPGSPAHKKAGDWIVAELTKLKLSVKEQKAEILGPDGKKIPMRNIIAQYNPKARKRYLMSAHWDNRPWADQDTVDKDKPILGVNDGGSGVAVLLAVAKQISFFKDDKNFGVDFIFFDDEDLGNDKDLKSFCLGTQYWVSHVWPENYVARLAFNYDMVGRKDSIFPEDIVSATSGEKSRAALVKSAKELGFEKYFPNKKVGGILDDHVFISRLYFPVADVIGMTAEGKFVPEWHTHKDTSDVISVDVLNVIIDVTLNMFKDEIVNYKREDLINP